ncbi:transposase [Cohnella abietis]|uniref:transposase n=1 Tax=Cohnella abietis TaxID=2507935 RepID=UPI00102E2EE9|nr:transposase [Cohnella abietis]
MDQPASFQTLCLSSTDEQFWVQMIYNARWPDGFCCPSCGNRHAYSILTRRLPLYECSSCHVQTSLTKGTIMEGSRTPLRLWLLAIHLHSQPEGINALRLASIIGTTYKTSWLICHKIRHAMSKSDESDLLKGLVRINFAQYGTPYNPTIYRHPQEQPLLIGATINEQGEYAHIKIKQAVEECSYSQFTCPLDKHPFIRKHVDSTAKEIIAVTLKYSKNRNRQLLQICNSASNWINDLFMGIGPKHLQAYLDQYCYHFNRSVQNQQGLQHLLKICTSTATIIYPELIRKSNIKPKLRVQYANYLKSVS